MATGRAILKLSDGTNEIDLLGARFEFNSRTFLVEDWTPQIADWKDGGTWSSSALSNGRQLRYRAYGNVTETLSFKAVDLGQDELIVAVEDLLSMLEQAADYWTAEWSETPVYLIARATEETLTRYAILHRGYVPELDNWYAQPFIQPDPSCDAMLDALTLVIERGHWQDEPPGVWNSLEISALQDGEGQETTTSDQVYVSAKHNTSQISHIFVEDGGVFGANLFGGGTPYALLPAVPAANDRVYFGVDTGAVGVDTGPFCSLVFDLSQAQADIADIDWEYWNGAWVALAPQDNTDANGAMTGAAFDTAGVNSVHWEQPSDWATVAVNGVQGYWVRAEVQDPGTAPPIQQNRDVYSILWPYVEIDEASGALPGPLGSVEAGGTLPNLARIAIRNQSNDSSGGLIPLYSTRVLCGLRSLSRDDAASADFSPYINMADEQQAGGWTVTAAGGNYTFQNDTTTPSGRKIQCLNIPAAGALMATAYTDSPTYIGVYHAFLRVVGGSSNIDLQLRGQQGSTAVPEINLTGRVTVTATPAVEMLDMGIIRIPFIGKLMRDEITTNSRIYIRVYGYGDGADDIDLIDLILMPVDEWALDTYDPSPWPAGAFGGVVLGDRGQTDATYLDIDSIGMPKVFLRSILKLWNDDGAVTGYRTIANGPAIVQANAKQRLWFLFDDISNGNQGSKHEVSASITMFHVQRYLGARGTR